MECLVYIDDILVFGSTSEEHNRRLRHVLQRLASAGLVLKPSKCRFGITKTEFPGYVVSDKGIHPDPANVDKIRNYPRPTNVKQVRAFIGLGSYYRRFIQNFATITAPLHKLTEKEEDWKWTPACEEVFEAIRNSLSNDIVQCHPDYDRPFIADCDASDVGMGAILSQVDDDGLERSVTVNSRKFTTAEGKWHIREEEALAIIWALDNFRPFILGTKFLVRTDHSSLEWLLKAKTGRLGRWALKLAEYGAFTIQHRAGSTHSNVDAFTRAFSDSEAMPDIAVIDSLTLPLKDAAFLPTRAQLIEAQRDDKSCIRLRELRKARMHDGVIGLGEKYCWRPVLPAKMVEPLAKSWHENALGTHLGARKLLSQISRHYVLIKAKQIVKHVAMSCLPCLQRKPPKRKFGKMASSPPSVPWRTVAMVFAGPYLESQFGNNYVLVITDQFTKWVELIATKDQQAITVVSAFYERIICRHGCPGSVLSDNGPQFASKLVEMLCSYFGMQKIFSSIYYPQGGGYAERFMRTLTAASPR